MIDDDGPNVESVADDFMRQGLVALDTSLRTLAPSQCLRSALHDDLHRIFLVPAVDMNENTVSDIQAKVAGTKRRASDDLLDQARPRKIQLIGGTHRDI